MTGKSASVKETENGGERKKKRRMDKVKRDQGETREEITWTIKSSRTK